MEGWPAASEEPPFPLDCGTARPIQSQSMIKLALTAPIATFAEPDWLLIGICEGERLPCAADLADIPVVHDFEGLIGPSQWIAVVHPDLVSRFCESTAALRLDMAGSSGAIVLVGWRAAPEKEAKTDCRITSFLCSAPVFRSALQWAPKGPFRLRQLCFYLLDALINGRIAVDRLLVRQLPLRIDSTTAPETKSDCVVIMPHRGRMRHLATALGFLHHDGGPHPCIRVGLDVDYPEEYTKLATKYPKVEFFVARPAPVGPYVIRQELAHRSSEPVIVLHDSDDVSSSDRLEVLRKEMRRTDCDFVGSHELRVDEIEKEVAAIRFPLDVTAALRRGPGHSLLHATAMIGRSQFLAVGGLSTDQRVANDTQFLFRAYFGLKIRNVDEFLYLRRRHSRALTVHPATCNAIPLRFQLDAAWRADFGAVQRGEMRLEESSLRPRLRTEAFHLTPLPPGSWKSATNHE